MYNYFKSSDGTRSCSHDTELKPDYYAVSLLWRQEIQLFQGGNARFSQNRWKNEDEKSIFTPEIIPFISVLPYIRFTEPCAFSLKGFN